MAFSHPTRPAADWNAILLVLDDSPDDALLLRTAVREVGYNGPIIEAGAVREALDGVNEALAGEPGRVVLVADYFLPGETSQAFLDAIREREDRERVRVVITSSALAPGVVAALTTQVASVQEKPLDWSGYLRLAGELRSMLAGEATFQDDATSV